MEVSKSIEYNHYFSVKNELSESMRNEIIGYITNLFREDSQYQQKNKEGVIINGQTLYSAEKRVVVLSELLADWDIDTVSIIESHIPKIAQFIEQVDNKAGAINNVNETKKLKREVQSLQGDT